MFLHRREEARDRSGPQSELFRRSTSQGTHAGKFRLLHDCEGDGRAQDDDGLGGGPDEGSRKQTEKANAVPAEMIRRPVDVMANTVLVARRAIGPPK